MDEQKIATGHVNGTVEEFETLDDGTRIIRKIKVNEVVIDLPNKVIEKKARDIKKGDRIFIDLVQQFIGTVLECRHGLRKVNVEKDGKSTVIEQSYIIAMPDDNPRGDIPMHKHFDSEETVFITE